MSRAVGQEAVHGVNRFCGQAYMSEYLLFVGEGTVNK